MPTAHLPPHAIIRGMNDYAEPDDTPAHYVEGAEGGGGFGNAASGGEAMGDSGIGAGVGAEGSLSISGFGSSETSSGGIGTLEAPMASLSQATAESLKAPGEVDPSLVQTINEIGDRVLGEIPTAAEQIAPAPEVDAALLQAVREFADKAPQKSDATDSDSTSANEQLIFSEKTSENTQSPDSTGKTHTVFESLVKDLSTTPELSPPTITHGLTEGQAFTDIVQSAEINPSVTLVKHLRTYQDGHTSLEVVAARSLTEYQQRHKIEFEAKLPQLDISWDTETNQYLLKWKEADNHGFPPGTAEAIEREFNGSWEATKLADSIAIHPTNNGERDDSYVVSHVRKTIAEIGHGLIEVKGP
jgi:hypothetical protein